MTNIYFKNILKYFFIASDKYDVIFKITLIKQ